MADIHILRVDEKVNGHVKVEVAYHVVVPATIQPPGTAAGLYPADTSRVSIVVDGLGGTELANMQNGILFEEVRIWLDNRQARTLAQIRDLIRANWHVVQAEIDTQLLSDYAFYAQTFARS